MPNILIVEDDININNLLCEVLRKPGYTSEQAFSGTEAKLLLDIKEKAYTLVLLDLMLTGASGEEVLKEIRKQGRLPVIVLTAKDSIDDKIGVLTDGADDYITKPFSMLILGKRITALLRRSQSKPAVNMIKLGDVTVDFSGYTACDENGKIDITPKELEILKVLIDNKGLVLSRNQILDDVWGYDCDVIDRTIDAYIRNIRKKLRLDCITTVKGIGYKFEMGQEI